MAAPEWMSVDDVATKLGLSPRRVRALKESIGFTRWGGALWFAPADVAAFAALRRPAGRPKGPAQPPPVPPRVRVRKSH